MSRLPRIRICKPNLGRIPFTTDRGNRASLSKLLIPKTFGSLRAQFCGAKNQRQYLRTRQTLSCSMPSKRGIVHPQRSAKPKSTDETRRLTDIDEPGEESLSLTKTSFRLARISQQLARPQSSNPRYGRTSPDVQA